MEQFQSIITTVEYPKGLVLQHKETHKQYYFNEDTEIVSYDNTKFIKLSTNQQSLW